MNDDLVKRAHSASSMLERREIIRNGSEEASKISNSPEWQAASILREQADRIKKLETELTKEIEISNKRGNHIEFVLLPQMADLEAERDVAYETAVRQSAAQAMKWLDDPDDDASLSGYILSLIGDDD